MARTDLIAYIAAAIDGETGQRQAHKIKEETITASKSNPELPCRIALIERSLVG
jgi:hypothetical protein